VTTYYARAHQALDELENLTGAIAEALEMAVKSLNAVLYPVPAMMTAASVTVPEPLVNEHPGPDFAPPRF